MHMKLFNRAYLPIMALSMAMGLSSCQDLDGIKSRLDNLETTVESLQSATRALTDAYTQGKIVTSVKPLAEAPAGGWLISFSDNTDVQIKNGMEGIDGINGVTPFFKVDVSGYWTISYDNGTTFEAILDEEENKIKAVGHEGVDGADGVSVRLEKNKEGNYVIQTYNESDPSKVLHETPTEICADSRSIISSFSQDDRSHLITMTMADGTTYTFNQHFTQPKSISLLTVKPLSLTTGSKASIEFRVNPSNASISVRNLVLDKVGSGTRSFDVTAPSGYTLISVEQVYDGNTMKTGQYRATIQDTKQGVSYQDKVALVLSIPGTGSQSMQISSETFSVKNFVSNLNTGLPIVYISTPNASAINSREIWTEGVDMTIVNPDNTIDYQGSTSMRGRGNSTWWYGKKPYALKLDKKDKILGMKKHKRWCLLANCIDRTLMRNAVAFEISRKTSLEYTPDGRFVELILNGEHKGCYYLCEQIKVDENRVNVAELDETATSGSAITGGYVFELDTYYDEEYKFKSARFNYPWMFKDPDVVNPAQFNYVANYVSEMENALLDPSKFANREFESYMDLTSFVDYWIINELAMNEEVKGPKSTYMNKDIDGKMKAGPVWDFDWGTFVTYKTDKFSCKDAVYYGRLFQDPGFVSLVKTRWNQLKPALSTEIPAFIDAKKAELAKSDVLNIRMWPLNWGERPNNDESLSFDAAVDQLKRSYMEKLNWMDAQILSM